MAARLALGAEYHGSFVGNAAGLTNYPTATVGNVGILQPDGTTITIGASGIITAHAGGSAGIGLIGGFGTNTALYFPYATNLVSTNTLLNGNTTNAGGGILITNIGSGNGFQIGPSGILSNGVPFGGGSPFTNTSGQVLNPYTNQAPVAFSNVIFINAAGNIVGGITNGVIYASNLFTYLVGSASVAQISNAVSLLVESSLSPFFTNSATVTNSNTGQATVITGSSITASNVLSQTLVTTNGGNSPNGDFTNLNQQTIGGTGIASTNFALSVSNAPQYVSTNISLNTVNVKSFGAKGNGQIVNFANVATASTTLTSTNGNWTSAIVGQVVFLPFCGTAHTNGFTTTVASVTSATNLTLTSGPTTGNTNIYVVIGTDDTAAITNANNFICTNGQSPSNTFYAGGTLIFPAGIYIVNGALADAGAGTAHHNAQIYFPGFYSNLTVGPVIRWQGAAGGIVGQTFGPSNTCYAAGTTLISTLPDGASGRFIDCQNFTNQMGGTLYNFGGGAYAVNGNNFEFDWDSINFMGPPNPSMDAMSFQGAGGAQVKNCVIFAGQDFYHVNQPIYTNSVGLNMPAQNNNAKSIIDNVQIWGFYNGLKVGEHLEAGEVGIFTCQNAVTGDNNNNGHIIKFNHLLSQSSPCVINAENGLYWNLDAVIDLEDSALNAPWTIPIYAVLADTNNVVRGHLRVYETGFVPTAISIGNTTCDIEVIPNTAAPPYHSNPVYFKAGLNSSNSIAVTNGATTGVALNTDGSIYTNGVRFTGGAAGAVSSVSALDGSVTVNPTTGAVTVTATPLGTAVTNWVSTSVKSGNMTDSNLTSGSIVVAGSAGLLLPVTISTGLTYTPGSPGTLTASGSGGTAFTNGEFFTNAAGAVATTNLTWGAGAVSNFTENYYGLGGGTLTLDNLGGSAIQIGGNANGVTMSASLTLSAGYNINFSGAGNAPINAATATGVSTFGGAVNLVAAAYSGTTNVLTPTATAYSQALATLASGYTNTTVTNNAYYSYNGTSGSAIWYWTAGSGTRSPIQTNTIVASGGGFPLQPNCGVQITSGVGVNAAVVFKP